MTGQAFMYTPGGAVPIAQDGTPQAVVDGGPTMAGQEAFPGAVTHIAAPQRIPQAQVQTQCAHPASVSVMQPAALSPRAVVKAASARVRQLKTELNRIKRLYRGDGTGTLERELAELERLVAAAKQKPLAVVRNIDHARHVR